MATTLEKHGLAEKLLLRTLLSKKGEIDEG
jgi:hypothetical protein